MASILTAPHAVCHGFTRYLGPLMITERPRLAPGSPIGMSRCVAIGRERGVYSRG